MKDHLFVLGADDPEMSEIESVLRAAGVACCHALQADGRRVHAGNAYRSVAAPAPEPGSRLVLVECGFDDDATLASVYDVVRIDHHRPGDPGWGKPPAEFFRASSMGQVLKLLVESDVLGCLQHDNRALEECAITSPRPGGYERCYTPTAGQLQVAAADHCLAAAYAGQCPGVDPAALRAFRVQQRAAFQKRSIEEIERDTEAARELLRSRKSSIHPVFIGEKHVPELPEAACIEGVAYVAQVAERDGRMKEVLGGATTPALVEEWMSSRRAEGREVYGDPARGFAGAYLLVKEAV